MKRSTLICTLAMPAVFGPIVPTGFAQDAAPAAEPVPPPAAETANTDQAAPSPNPSTTETTNTGAGDKPPGQPPAQQTPEDRALAELRREVARLNAERERLAAENAIAKERLAKELAERRAQLERETLRTEEEKARLNRELEEVRARAERELARLKVENERLTLEMSIAKNRAEIQANELRLKEAEMKAEITKISQDLERKEKELTALQYADANPVYTENPLNGKTLTISDRRIPLNGPIVARTADEVAERIDFYNNRDPRYPIFIVIDNCPGGSVMAGYKILKAMEGSRAPVYVVVKSFAASMAACITTLADKSFAYPNAVILHHQISGYTYGNLTEQRESLAEIEEWWQRLAGPIAKKMGIGTDEFIKRMYEKVSSGDWSEFADRASELKWVDVIVDEIRETSQLKHPDLPSPNRRTPQTPQPLIVPSTTTTTSGPYTATQVPVMVEMFDEKGRPFCLLPRPNPKDVYYLYNPDGYYRVP